MSANVLFVYGRSGSGKTRLLQMVEESCSERSIMRVGCEEFTADMFAACNKAGNFSEFLDRYKQVKNLLLDNLFVLRKGTAAAEQMRRLIQARVAQGKLTILASDLSFEDVTESLPGIAQCLKEHDVVQLRLAPGRPSTKPLLEDLMRCCQEDHI